MFTKKFIVSIMLFFLFLTVTKAYAGFGLESTRVIFNEQSKTESVVAFNTDKNINLLVQSWIENFNGEVTSDFVATPPIFKLKAEQKNTIQITKNITSETDKEMLYWLNVKFIAPTDENTENVLRYSVSNRIKIIFRPDNLRYIDLKDEINKLAFSKEKNELVVRNPSKIYVNIAEMELNGHEVNAPSYISPESTVKIKTNISMDGNKKISLKYINDFGSSSVLTFYF